MKINIKELVNRADLHYDGPAERCEEGLPIGNGRMGSLIWTSPDAIKLQINRSDVFANGPKSRAFHEEHRDYGYACAYFDLCFVGFGPDVFDEATKEHLDIYDAVANISAHDVDFYAFAAEDDVFAFKVSDMRETPCESAAKLRLLRAAEVETLPKHTARSYLERKGDVCILRQVFREEGYYCSSAVAVRIVGRDTISRISDENNGTRRILPEDMCGFGASGEYEMRMCMPAEKGEYYVYISSAATFDPEYDVAAEAVEKVTKASEKGYDKLFEENCDLWHQFWSKSYISLDGFPEAEILETHYQYYLYIMNSCSRNAQFAPNFGGLLFSPRGDKRHWGTMQWWNNITLTYNAVLPSGHPELIDPYLNMYYNCRERLETAARQHFGAEGIYIFETMHVLGPEPLPAELEEEFRNFILDRGPSDFTQCSQALQELAKSGQKLESRWDFLNTGEKKPYAWCTHLFSSAAFLAYHFYLRYAFSKDIDFLREKAYPMISKVCEFFRTYPNTTKEVYPKHPHVADGKYHIYGTTDGESNWGAYDSCGSLTAMHGIFRVGIECAKILGIDEDKVTLWQELLDNLTDIPTNKCGDLPEKLKDTADDPEYWIYAPGNNWPFERIGAASYPLIHLDLCTLETKYKNPEMYRIGRNTYERINADSDEKTGTGEMSGAPRLWASMGDPERLVTAMSGQLRCVTAAEEHCWYKANGCKAPYANRLTAREGVNAISAQRLGNAAAGLQMGLLQSSGGAPAAPGVIYIFPAWDKNNGAKFCLWARDGFKVESACANGEITYCEITSTLGGECRLHNPYDGNVIISGPDGDITLSGTTVKFDTKVGGVYTVKKG